MPIDEAIVEFFRPMSHFTRLTSISTHDFHDLVARYNIQYDPDKKGYPVFAFIRALVLDRRKFGVRRTLNLAQLEEIKRQEEIRKLQLFNDEKSKILIKRSYAFERIKLTFQNVASKIRYAIKNVAPRLVGLDDAKLVEEILIKSYNGALKLLEEEALNVTWEDDKDGAVEIKTPKTEASVLAETVKNTEQISVDDIELDTDQSNDFAAISPEDEIER